MRPSQCSKRERFLLMSTTVSDSGPKSQVEVLAEAWQTVITSWCLKGSISFAGASDFDSIVSATDTTDTLNC